MRRDQDEGKECDVDDGTSHLGECRRATDSFRPRNSGRLRGRREYFDFLEFRSVSGKFEDSKYQLKYIYRQHSAAKTTALGSENRVYLVPEM